MCLMVGLSSSSCNFQGEKFSMLPLSGRTHTQEYDDTVELLHCWLEMMHDFTDLC